MPQSQNLSLEDRVSRLMVAMRIKSRSKIAKILGISRARLYDYQAGKAQPRYDLLKRLQELEVENGLAERSDVQIKSGESVLEKGERYGKARLPIIPWERVEECQRISDLPMGWPMVVPVSFREIDAFAVTVEGDSMVPFFLPGDTIACAPDWGFHNGDFLLGRLKLGGALILRRVIATDRITAQIHAINPSYGSQDVDLKEDFDWVVRVVTLVRNLGQSGPSPRPSQMIKPEP